jgi:hypothetical protein
MDMLRRAQVELVSETMVEAFSAFRDRRQDTKQEEESIKRRPLLAAKDLSTRDIAKLMDSLLSDARLTGVERHEITWVCHQVMGGAAPFVWREYLISHRDLPDWQKLLEVATRQCVMADFKRTLEMTEQEKSRANPEIATTGMRSSMLLALADRDPKRTATYLDQLPANKGKQNLATKIEEAGRKGSSPAR